MITGKLDVRHLCLDYLAELAAFDLNMDIEYQQVDEELEQIPDMGDSEGEQE